MFANNVFVVRSCEQCFGTRSRLLGFFFGSFLVIKVNITNIFLIVTGFMEL